MTKMKRSHPSQAIAPSQYGTGIYRMDEQSRKGYARLVRDLAELDHHDRFQDTLTRAYGTMEELGRLIERAKSLSRENSSRKNPGQR